MEKTNREIRALLSSMAPARAAQAVRLVGLPPDEETAVLAVDVHGQSCLQTAALSIRNDSDESIDVRNANLIITRVC